MLLCRCTCFTRVLPNSFLRVLPCQLNLINERIISSRQVGIYFTNSQHYSTERVILVKDKPEGHASGTTQAPGTSTYSADEVNKFRNAGDRWWNLDGEFKVLHSMNRLRVPLVRDGLTETYTANRVLKDAHKPLQGFRVLDVGCGGGILAEPLARLGATVTGLDAGEECIAVAKSHAEKNPKNLDNLTYICGTLEEHIQGLETSYDAVVASEIVEHVASLEAFLDACATAIRPGGSLFVSTINKTPQSFLMAICLAEYVMGLVPRGTHDWNKFVEPSHLKQLLKQRGLHTRLLHGMFYLPPTDQWQWMQSTDVNYALHAVKATTETAVSG